ncbi:MFS transporter [uncultured Nocardioides sp.]|uniref:MFS transporter n=1 Tax=uncultured Nocardioides sp. TaxID=198441 RepID=UPI00262B1EED|nr:MFS transporter [uncultured Nocardioides sp.]
MSLEIKPSAPRAHVGNHVDASRPLVPVALGTALVLVTYVTPIATIPATAADLGAGPVARAWILSSMSVGLAGLLLASGVIGDALGRRRAYVVGLVGTAVGAVLCAVAAEPLLFVAGRIVQGGGGAAVLACGLAALAHRYPLGPERLRATSVWGASVGLGIAGGAVLAALLDFGSGWRPSYWVTAVAAILLVPVTRRWVAESAAAVKQRVDLPGLILLVAGMTLAVSALTQGRNGIDAPTVVLGVLAMLALAGFGIVERRVAAPLLDPALLAHPRFRAATAGSLVLGAGMIGMASFTPAMVQLGYGEGLWAASLPAVAWAGTGVVTSLLVRRIPHPLEGPRPVALFLLVVAAGQLLTWGLSADSSLWRLVLPFVVAGAGTGVLNALLGREAIASVPPDRAAMGSGANNTARYLGAACGITLFLTVATHAGDDLFAGWNVAALVTVALTLIGAAAIALTSRRTAVTPTGDSER